MERSRGETIIAIDLLRVAAATLVVAYHLGTALPRHLSWQVFAMLDGQALSNRSTAATWFGWVGVEIFFVVSGLVIAQSATGSAPAPFLRRRLLRLAPALWLCATISFVTLQLAAPQLRVAPVWVKSMLLLPTDTPIDPSYWTLSLEWGFYLLVAAVLTGGSGAVRLERLAVAMAAASALFRFAVAITGDAAPAERFYFELTLLPHGCFFAAGILIGAIWRDGPARWRVGWLAVALATGAVEIVAHARFIGAAIGYAGSPAIPLSLFAAAVALVIAAPRVQPLLARTIGGGRVARAGQVTYPLYLIHQVAGAAIAIALVRVGCPLIAAMVIAAAAIAALATWIAWVAEPLVRHRLATLLGPLSPSRDPRPDTPASASLPAG